MEGDAALVLVLSSLRALVVRTLMVVDRMRLKVRLVISGGKRLGQSEISRSGCSAATRKTPLIGRRGTWFTWWTFGDKIRAPNCMEGRTKG